MSATKKDIKITVVADDALGAKLVEYRSTTQQQTGLRISMSEIAASLLRQALNQKQAQRGS